MIALDVCRWRKKAATIDREMGWRTLFPGSGGCHRSGEPVAACSEPDGAQALT
jgi:hypothetical protein